MELFSEILDWKTYQLMRDVAQVGFDLGVFVIIVLLITIAINSASNNDRNIQVAKEGLKIALITTILLGTISTGIFFGTIKWAISTFGGASGDGGFNY